MQIVTENQVMNFIKSKMFSVLHTTPEQVETWATTHTHTRLTALFPGLPG